VSGDRPTVDPGLPAAPPALEEPTPETVAPDRLQAWRRAGEPLLILDVRLRQRWVADPERIAGATWVPIDELPRRAADLPPGRRLIVYCS
jgi:rhodanese-related sulfurtransferase